MLIFNPHSNEFDIDPYYLSIKPLGEIYYADKDPTKVIGKAKLLWLYHMYNPHSPFRDYRITTKSAEIVKATFPDYYIKTMEKTVKHRIDQALVRNKQIEEDNKLIDELIKDADDKGKVPKKKELIYIPNVKIYDPEFEEEMQEAIEWYRDHHLKQTPLWDSVSAYDEAMYNLANIIRKSDSTPNDIRIASTELDLIPLKRERMRQQAVKDEAQTLKVSGDKNIKRSERLPQDKARKAVKT